MNIVEITRELNAALGPTLVAALTGESDPTASREWENPDASPPTEEQATRLRVAYETWSAVSTEHGADVARVWFIGANPWLGYDTAVDALREGRFAEVAAAVRAMLDDDSFSG
ncbi:MAG: hypothetical protein JWM49_2504 [Microbacteriaceae bacterium]|nr:hypothetical protein [Microbacteriaceae bacterium]